MDLGVAQMVERSTADLGVPGSILAGRDNFFFFCGVGAKPRPRQWLG